ncbi:MAG TPA: glycosyltransferase, partial [Candidatus Hydrogenedentes bacterium]|nr:glycosyltransferase [Candidatus Hydrogenedentota bacterium]
MTRPLTHVLVINWNGLAHLDDCFRSLTACPGDHLRFVLVDNASTDGSADFVRGRFGADPRVELLVLDRGNFRLVRMDLATKKITASIKVGRQPFGIALSHDLKQAFVANVGVYSYPLILGATPENMNALMISHHPYGENTHESREGTLVEGKQIPGLGSPNHPDAM